MKFGVADFGMNVWDGGCYDLETRWEALREIGYDGIERLPAVSAEEAVLRAARLRRMSLDFATCQGPTVDACLQWTSGLGKAYIWANVTGTDFPTFCRQVNLQAAACARWGLRLGLHNHMGTLVETEAQLTAFLTDCPSCGLILDTAHLAAVGGHPVEIVQRYAERLVAVHLKDWRLEHPEIGMAEWWKRGRFCELGAGNIALDNRAVLRALREVGYDGWVFVEQDTHIDDPLAELAVSRAYLRD